MILRRLRVFLIWATILLISFLIALYGAISVPVLAFSFNDIYINFSSHTVANYDNIPIVLNKNTFNMGVYGESAFKFSYKMDACPTGIENKTLLLATRLTDKDNLLIYQKDYPISVICSTSYRYVEQVFPFFNLSVEQNERIKQAITENNNEMLRIQQIVYDNYNGIAYNNIRLDFRSLEAITLFFYEFNTTYYFDHIAFDYESLYFSTVNATIKTGGAVPGNANAFLLVAYDSTDYWRIYNSDFTYSTTRPRTKLHIPIGRMITGYGIGAGTYAVAEYESAYYVRTNGLAHNIFFSSRLHLLNYSNTQQTFPGATLPTLEYQTCNAWDIPCHLGNALVYIGKDLPITSDIYGILSRAWQIVSNGMYAINGIFGAVFNSGGLVSGNFFGIALMIAFGVGLVSMIITGGDDDD